MFRVWAIVLHTMEVQVIFHFVAYSRWIWVIWTPSLVASNLYPDCRNSCKPHLTIWSAGYSLSNLTHASGCKFRNFILGLQVAQSRFHLSTFSPRVGILFIYVLGAQELDLGLVSLRDMYPPTPFFVVLLRPLSKESPWFCRGIDLSISQSLDPNGPRWVIIMYFRPLRYHLLHHCLYGYWYDYCTYELLWSLRNVIWTEDRLSP